MTDATPTQLDLMVDIETMDTIPTAAILTIGAVLFDPYAHDTEESMRAGPTFYRVIPIESNRTYKRTESEATRAWWAEQNAEAYAALTAGVMTPLDIALRELAHFAQTGAVVASRAWANDPDFDYVIIQDACRATGVKWPIQFYMNRSVRTRKDDAYPNGDCPNIGVGDAHNALDDTIRQALMIQHCQHVLDGLHSLMHVSPQQIAVN